MGDLLAVQDPNHAAIITLHSMMFYNTFINIGQGQNKLKILSVYKTNSATYGVVHTTTIPPGHFDIDGLLNYLNHHSHQIIDTHFYGLGSFHTPDTPAFYLSEDDPSKICFRPPVAGDGLGSDLKNIDSTHQYVGFYLIVDEITIPLLKIMGLVERGSSQSILNARQIMVENGVYYRVIGFETIQKDGYYVYNSGDSISAPSLPFYQGTNCINLGGPTCLTVALDNIYANSRNSYDSMNKGNTIAAIPIDAAYGYKNIYRQSSGEFGCVVTNLNMTQIRLMIRNGETGELVDFQGNDWVATLKIEYYEINNELQSTAAQEGWNRPSHSIYHHQVLDHVLPSSGKRKQSRMTHDYARPQF